MSAGKRDESVSVSSRSTTRASGPSGAAVSPAAASHSKGGGGLQPLQQKLQQHIDREDRRIKRLTEAILYEFLPDALRAVAAGREEGACKPECCGEAAAAAQELSQERCRAVAGATLGVASLMNAPPGFLEFLLCVPWASLGQMYPGPLDTSPVAPADAGLPSQQGSLPTLLAPFEWAAAGVVQQGAAAPAAGGGLPGLDVDQPAPAPPCGAPAIPRLEGSQLERKALVNLPLDPRLMPCVLGFLLRAEHAEDLPPMLRSAPEDPLASATMGPAPPSVAADPTCSREEILQALLDGCTPLHCAALRGNPALVSHLLSCGADPLVTNAAGELPLECVPVCGDRCVGRKPACRCMPPKDQEAWECRSRLSRTLIIRRSVLSWGLRGLRAWLRIVVLCLLCLLGLWGHNTSMQRPALAAHMASRQERRRQLALRSARSVLSQMRAQAAEGHALLGLLRGCASGKQEAIERGTETALEGVGEREGELGREVAVDSSAGGSMHSLERREAGGRYHAPHDKVDRGAGGGPASSGQGGFPAAERAFECFSVAVDVLQTLEVQPGGLPRSVAEVGAGASGQQAQQGDVRVGEAEQGAVLEGWAQAAVMKFRHCSCSGCASLALHTCMASHRHLAQHFARLDRQIGRAHV